MGCDRRLGLTSLTPTGYTKGRWQDAGDAEGEPDPVRLKNVQKVLRLGTNAVPLLINCLADERKTKTPIWSYWPETKVGDIAFAILCDLFSDPAGQPTLAAAIDWGDLQDESPGQPAWTALANYISKHGRGYIQQAWSEAWAESAGRVYWDSSANCFRVKLMP